MKTRLLIYIALVTDILITITKFTAAIITGSSAMISEGIHSVIDAVSQLLLLLGLNKSKKKPDGQRPFGYGRELYFWSFIVSLIIFIVGGCVSVYEGLQRLKRPAATGSATLDYIILSVALVFTAISTFASLKSFNKERGRQSFWKAFRKSKDPATFIILLGDLGDLAGIAVAFIGIYLGHHFKNPVYDAAASMIIGGILLVTSAFLVTESKSLLLGESISRATLKEIIAITENDVTVIRVKKQFSVYLAPEEVVLQMVTQFKKNLTTQQITEAIHRISVSIREKFPRIKQLFIEPA